MQYPHPSAKPPDYTSRIYNAQALPESVPLYSAFSFLASPNSSNPPSATSSPTLETSVNDTPPFMSSLESLDSAIWEQILSDFHDQPVPVSPSENQSAMSDIPNLGVLTNTLTEPVEEFTSRERKRDDYPTSNRVSLVPVWRDAQFALWDEYGRYLEVYRYYHFGYTPVYCNAISNETAKYVLFTEEGKNEKGVASLSLYAALMMGALFSNSHAASFEFYEKCRDILSYLFDQPNYHVAEVLIALVFYMQRTSMDQEPTGEQRARLYLLTAEHICKTLKLQNTAVMLSCLYQKVITALRSGTLTEERMVKLMTKFGRIQSSGPFYFPHRHEAVFDSTATLDTAFRNLEKILQLFRIALNAMGGLFLHTLTTSRIQAKLLQTQYLDQILKRQLPSAAAAETVAEIEEEKATIQRLDADLVMFLQSFGAIEEHRLLEDAPTFVRQSWLLMIYGIRASINDAIGRKEDAFLWAIRFAEYAMKEIGKPSGRNISVFVIDVFGKVVKILLENHQIYSAKGLLEVLEPLSETYPIIKRRGGEMAEEVRSKEERMRETSLFGDSMKIEDMRETVGKVMNVLRRKKEEGLKEKGLPKSIQKIEEKKVEKQRVVSRVEREEIEGVDDEEEDGIGGEKKRRWYSWTPVQKNFTRCT